MPTTNAALEDLTIEHDNLLDVWMFGPVMDGEEMDDWREEGWLSEAEARYDG